MLLCDRVWLYELTQVFFVVDVFDVGFFYVVEWQCWDGVECDRCID